MWFPMLCTGVRRRRQKTAMKPGGGKNKGSSFERQVCRILTEWITGKPRPEIFWRTATSGGKFTVDAKSGIRGKMPGDVMAIAGGGGSWFAPPDGAFVIECKSVGRLDLMGIVFRKGDLYSWWTKLVQLAKGYSIRPLLIAHQKGRPTLVMFDGEFWRLFTDYGGGYPHGTIRARVSPSDEAVICVLDDWLKFFDPATIKLFLRVTLGRR